MRLICNRSEYWLNPKIDNLAEHEKQVAEICALYSDAPQLHNAGTHLISTDEKTSIQALERVAPTKPMISGHPEKIEFEYKRQGTKEISGKRTNPGSSKT